MSPRVLSSLFVLAVTALFSLVIPRLLPDDPLAAADKAWSEHTYSEALQHYQVAAKDPRFVAARDRVMVRIGLCLARLERFDEALDELKAFAAEKPGTLPSARAQLERGVIAATMPHYHYLKDGKRTFGKYVQGGTYFYTHTEDNASAVTDLEAARVVFANAAADAMKEGKEARETFSRDHLRCHLELAAVVEVAGVVATRDPALESTDPFRDTRAWEDRIVAAFDAAITHQESAASLESEVLARYLKGSFCRRLLQTYKDCRWRADGGIDCVSMASSASVPRIVLPAGKNPIRVFEQASERGKDLKLADSLLAALATVRMEHELFVDSVATWKILVEKHPKSPFIGDARAQIEQITFPRIGVTATHSTAPDVPFEIPGSARNVTKISLTISRFALARTLLDDSLLDDEDVALTDAERLIRKAGAPTAGDAVATLDFPTADEGIHRPVSLTFKVPALPRGTYVADFTGAGIHFRSLLIVSDLALVEKVDDMRTLVFAVDATTGTPVKGADVVVRERFSKNGLFGRKDVVRYTRGVSDATGVFVRPHSPDNEERGAQIECLAVDGDRVAIVERVWHWQTQREGTRRQAYVMTDRPVYRPGDPVHFAMTLRTGRDHDVAALAGQSCEVRIRDAKGQTFLEQNVRTDDDGMISQDLVLGKEPPLGMWHIDVRDGKNHFAGSFRVEEYLKPEFKVSVSPPVEPVRLGEKARVTIAANYYFGGGVPGGQVTWRVMRDPWWPGFGSGHEDWEQSYRFGMGSQRPRGGGSEVVLSGAGSLDSEGRLDITFDTAAYAGRGEPGSRFSIIADVTDASRRTLNGRGSILVTKRALALDVSTRRGFFNAGETIECELQSQLPDGTPVAVAGNFRVSRVEPGPMVGGKPTEKLTPVHEAAATTDQAGTGFARWAADEGGLFSFVFEARDRFEQLTTAELRLWVRSPTFAAREFQFKNVELIPEKRTYASGEKAMILVNSNFADSSLFVTVDAGPRSLSWQVMRLTGKTGIVEIPIGVEHQPNIHVHVLSVRNGEFFEELLELFVPPVDRFLDVKVAFEKPEYRPGDQGRLVVTAKNDRGEPVAARCVVTALDASILDIQSDESPDIRQFFWGQRRSHNTPRSSSALADFGGYLVKNVAWGNYAIVGQPPAWWNQPGMVTRVLDGLGFGADEFEDGFLGFTGGRKQGVLGGGAEGAGKRGRLARRDAAAENPAAPAPMSAAPAAGGKPAQESAWGDDEKLDRDKDEATTEPKVRSDFRDAALWKADVVTDAGGRATIDVPFPEQLTTWRAKAWVFTRDTRVGQATGDVKTTKDVLVRLRAPRFFVEGDQITVSALVNNRTAAPQSVKVSATFDGEMVATGDPADSTVEIPARADRRVDWRVNVLRPGRTTIVVKAVSAADSDAMSMTYPVLEWGAEKRLFDGAVIDGNAAHTLSFLVPAERREETTRLRITMQPSLALGLLDALPYLIQYPYGCTEQTVSRFIPAVAVARTLREAGTTLDDVARNRRRPNDPRGAAAATVTQAELDDIIRAGLAKLTTLQNGDGGFGWWRADRSSPYLTAYALSGLLIAREADLAVDAGMIGRAADFLAGTIKTETRLEQAAFSAYVLAKAGQADQALLARIFKNRDTLSTYGKALLASGLKAAGETDDAKTVIRNLVDFVRRDDGNGTAHFDVQGWSWWWWNSLIETNAAVLDALLDVDPKDAMVAPLVKWLALNRRGNKWNNTRDTAQAVLALSRYARQSGELDPDLTVEVRLGDQAAKVVHITRANMFAFDDTIAFGPEVVPAGENRVSVSVKGNGRLYVNGEATFFTREADIAAAGRELLCERSYWRVKSAAESRKVDGRDVQVMKDTFEKLAPGDTVQSGEIVEVRLDVESKNDYEYLVFEDPKPSGFEPLEVKSGMRWGDGLCSNVELRDTKTAIFVTWLQQGTHAIKYRLRAELPGRLRVIPARGECMYTADVGGTTSSFRFTVADSGTR